MKFQTIRTKTVMTLGPSSSSPDLLGEMLKCGVDLIRLNFAHSSHHEHAQRMRLIRTQAEKLACTVGILIDLPGPKLRIGDLKNKQLEIHKGDTIVLSYRGVENKYKSIVVPYKYLTKDLKPGQPVYIADGIIRLRVDFVRNNLAYCQALTGGTVRAGNGVNLPKTSLSLKAFTKTDENHLVFGLKQRVDFVGISFVGSAEDILRARTFIRARSSHHPFIIAKIERREALKNLKTIIHEADGIMIARGDLGVEVPYAELPAIQEEIIEQSQQIGKPVIVATQVLESMVESSRPTRAEATDVANAVNSGVDAIMLSAETSVGKYPVESVHALHDIIKAQERRVVRYQYDEPLNNLNVSDVIVQQACRIAQGIHARVIVVPTRSGRTVARLSRYRPSVPILALVNHHEFSRKLVLHGGVNSIVMETMTSSNENMVQRIRVLLKKDNLARSGDRILFISNSPGVPRDETGIIQIVQV